MRKQFLVIACGTVVSFLLGTLVSMGLTANDIMPNPFESPASKIQIIRFTDPDEINVTSHHFLDQLRATTASFMWTPKNPQSNIILSVYCYFEVRWEAWTDDSQARVDLGTRIYVNGFYGYESNEYKIYTSLGDTTDWTSVAFQVNEFSHRVEPNLRPSWVRPNQESYNITLVLGSWSEHFWTPTYVRKINMVITAADGLPASG